MKYSLHLYGFGVFVFASSSSPLYVRRTKTHVHKVIYPNLIASNNWSLWTISYADTFAVELVNPKLGIAIILCKSDENRMRMGLVQLEWFGLVWVSNRWNFMLFNYYPLIFKCELTHTHTLIPRSSWRLMAKQFDCTSPSTCDLNL